MMQNDLQKLGFTVNDSRIYVTLLKIGLSSPANISEMSHVDRARVYDSLKRLVKRGVVEEEPVPRAPRYRAIRPEYIFTKIRSDYARRIKLSETLEEKLKQIKPINKEQNSMWAIQGEQKLRKKVRELIKSAQQEIYLILTPNFYASRREFQNISDLLIDKRIDAQDCQIKIVLQISKNNPDQKSIVNQIFHAGIDIYNWNVGNILPFGLILTEEGFIQIFLNNVTPKPKYGFGILMENCSKEQVMGFRHLCEWLLVSQCSQVVFKKKSKKENS